MALTPGSKLGPYEIQSPLGAGGMGEVYRARDTRLDRAVAIKILPAHLSDNPEAKQRFDREARAVSSLNHPNICTLHDVGHQEGTDYLVMEFLEGETLADRLIKGPLPPAQVLKYGIEICEGLETAHRKGVVHRDLKPGNIMLTKSCAKLMDFGLAKATAPIAASSSSLTMTLSTPAGSHPLTAQGTVVGTFQYMSPEQVEGKEADARSDIFALGAVLFEMATGKRAFEGKTTASVIAAVLAAEPQPISAIQPMSPPSLDRVVKTCIAKDPDERFQDVHDVKLQLQWIAEGGSQAGVPVPVAARRKTRDRVSRFSCLRKDSYRSPVAEPHLGPHRLRRHYGERIRGHARRQNPTDQGRRRFRLAETADDNQVHAGYALGIQQFGIRNAGDGGRETHGDKFRRLSAAANFSATRDDRHARLRKGKKRTRAPSLRTYQNVGGME